jgi:hypothetical protein
VTGVQTCALPICETLFFQEFPGFFVLVHDQPEDAEVGGVGQGQSPDIYASLPQSLGDFGQAARLVFQKNRDLFDFHGVLLQLPVASGQWPVKNQYLKSNSGFFLFLGEPGPSEII